MPDEMDVDSENEEAVSQWQKLCSQKVSHRCCCSRVLLDLGCGVSTMSTGQCRWNMYSTTVFAMYMYFECY